MSNSEKNKGKNVYPVANSYKKNSWDLPKNFSHMNFGQEHTRLYKNILNIW